MAIYTNVVQEFRREIEDRLTLNDVIDSLIANRLVDEKLYMEIWARQNDHLSYLLDIILKDGKRCAKFIDILGTIAHMKPTSESIQNSIYSIRHMIVIGGFPEFSLNYVVRNSVEWIDLANAIQEQALELDPQQCSTLVVHGLPGFGKSCLVNQVLQTRRFLDSSGGAMFWINLGEYSDTTTIINPMWNLYLTAVRLTPQVALTHRPEEIAILKNELTRLFLDESLSNSYVILDDVKSREVLDVFKLRCKIIVTTQDKNVAKDFEASFIRVTTGFTKKESLELLRKSLETDNLFSKEVFANRIHDLCDGCPMLLNIIGSILKDSKEEALATDVIWDSIIREIVKNDYLHHPTTMNVINMIKRFVNCLSPEVQKCFHSLAVFPKHVNIRPEILMILWEKAYFSVRQIMTELENKSLIVSFYNKDLRTYVYSIHSLVRTYLIERADANIRCYHKKLISNCDDMLVSSSPDNPIANYIFGYYGYHTKHAELYEKFEKYFDLRFIENKIKRVGSADLLTDYDTYKEYITKNSPFLQRKLEDYTKFVNLYSAHLHTSPETNIVQFAFFHENNSVHEEAKSIAVNNPEQLYFKLEPYSGVHKNFPTLKTKSSAISTCFLNSKEVLVGTSVGSIEVKSFHQYQHKVQRFEGHGDKITHLLLSPNGKSFLSISLDHTAKLWRFAEELDPQSPKLKQTHWRNLHAPDENFEPHQTFKMQDKDFITSAAFPYDNSDEIVTASQSGKITRWNVKTASVIKESALGLPISQISYVHDSQQIIFSYDGKVYKHTRENLQYNGQFGLRLWDISHLVLIPPESDFREVAVISSKKVEIWDYAKKIRRNKFETGARITAAVVCGDYLMVGTKNSIYLFHYRLRKMLQYNNNFGEPSALYMSADRLVFITLDKESVQRCEVLLEATEKPHVQDVAVFDCYWKDSQPIYFIINSMNKVDIFNGNSNILTGTEIGNQITCASFSICGNNLIFGTESGDVYVYNYKKNKSTKMTITDEEIHLIKCFERVHAASYTKMPEIIVAVASKKVVVILDSETIIPLDTSDKVTNVLYTNNYLIVVDVAGRLFTAKLSDNECAGWISNKYTGVIVADTHKGKRKHLLGVVCRSSDDYRFKVLSLDDKLFLKSVFEDKIIDVQPKCISFSAEGKLVSVGCEGGEIKIYNLESKMQDTMILHKSVEKLIFAPNSESILVSVGDQIAWWNLSRFEEKRDSADIDEAVPSRPRQTLIFTFDLWNDKKLHDTVPYLMASTNLHGKHLRYISASKDFQSFLVVDVEGNIYKLDIINT